MPSLLHSRDERFGFWKNHRLARIVASEFLHRIHGIKAKQRNEFHFIAVLANEQFRAPVALDLSRGNARKNFVAEHFFICFRVCAFRPPRAKCARSYVITSAMVGRGTPCAPFPCFDYEQEHEQEQE